LPEFKRILREQFFMLLIDRDGALRAIPGLLPAEEAQRRGAMDLLRRVVAAQGGEQEQVRVRLEEVEALFGLREAPAGTLVSFSPERRGKRPARSA
jgi:hypothetical protein